MHMRAGDMLRPPLIKITRKPTIDPVLTGDTIAQP